MHISEQATVELKQSGTVNSSLHFTWVEDHEKCIVITCVCVSVCLSAAACPHYCTDPDVTWGVVGDAPWLCTIRRICNRCMGCVAMATLWKCVAEPSGNPPGPSHTARTTHVRTHALAIKSTRLLRVRHYLQRGRSISSILCGCCNVNAKC